MDIRPLDTEADYDWALAEIAAYFDHEPAPGTPDAARFGVLAALIENYEAKHWPIEPPDPAMAHPAEVLIQPYHAGSMDGQDDRAG